jgi:HD domain-containing protein
MSTHAEARSNGPLAQIEELVRETFSLWDVVRVGFSWRHYYLNHTYRIRNLSVQMAEAEGGDPELLEMAAILHDITKRYDGNILAGPDGKRVLDEEGFWLNEMIMPDRSNWVTKLYDELELQGLIHHVSGAIITDRVLGEYGFDGSYRETVAEVVRGHLKPENLGEAEFNRRYRLIESRILYDADTIDPNLGLTAFYRNIQIHAGGLLRRGAEPDLEGYVRGLPRWVGMKDEFIDKMITARGREIAAERQERNRQLCAQLQEELEAFDRNAAYGMLGCVRYLMTDPEDPSLHRHARGLREEWLPAREQALAAERTHDRDAAAESLARARGFIELLEGEINGQY